MVLLVYSLAIFSQKSALNFTFPGSEICDQVEESIRILQVQFCKNPWILNI